MRNATDRRGDKTKTGEEAGGRYHKECVAGRAKVHSSRYFSRASAKVFRFFTADGATQFFSKWALENSVEIRATIEPDSQDVFLKVQQLRTLPNVV